MANNNAQAQMDVEGYEVVTTAIFELLNSYPGLTDGDEIRFSILDINSGKAFFASSGAIISQERISITEHVFQQCAYPFSVVCRASGLSDSRRIQLKEWVDNLGRWLEMDSIVIDGVTYKLNSLPELSGGRVFKRFSRTSPAYLSNVQGDQTEDWMINMTAYYENEFDR